MMDGQAQGNWADRLNPTARTASIVIALIAALLVFGAIVGVTVAVFEHGKLPNKPLAYVVFAGMLGLAALLSWFIAGLVRAVRRQQMSGFDRRYWRMWIVLVALGLPLGIAVGILGTGDDQQNPLSSMFSNSAISPLVAGLLGAAFVLLMVLAAVYYHRTIDDHEERAYLWGSTIAFYFLALAFPLHWLLARGDIVPVLTIGVALLLILLSCIVQAIAWALLKFR